MLQKIKPVEIIPQETSLLAKFNEVKKVKIKKRKFEKQKVDHIKIDLTRTQRKNLFKLAAYLNGELKTKFHMRHFHLEELTTCDTVCCAVGSGPFAGVGRIPRHGDWVPYATKHFTNGDAELFSWLFSGAWARVDNTPEGAAKRIFYFLEHGLPKNAKSQMNYVSKYFFRNPKIYLLQKEKRK